MYILGLCRSTLSKGDPPKEMVCEAGEGAQLVQCLPHMHKNPRLILSTQVKEPGVMVYTMSELRGQRQEEP